MDWSGGVGVFIFHFFTRHINHSSYAAAAFYDRSSTRVIEDKLSL